MYDELKIIIAISCLLYASYHDLKTRLVPKWIWWFMGIPALIFYGVEAYGRNPALLIMLLPLFGTLVEALVERDELSDIRVTWPFFLIYLVSFAGFVWGYITMRDEPLFLGALSAVAVSIFFFVLYYTNVIHGAADAKALVMLTLLFYRYPDFTGLFAHNPPEELSVLFPFSLSVLLLASLTVVLLPLYFLVLNLMKGDKSFPEMLLGYRLDIESARKRKVWPMLVVENGRPRRILLPRKYMEIDWDALENAGIKRLWVTPKVPFIVPITIGFVLTLIFGNPVFYLF